MIGDRLQEIRKNHGDTQQRLAEKLNVSLHAVRCWEQDKSAPSHEMLVTICRLYHISSDYLLGLTDNSNAYSSSAKVLSDDNRLLLNRFEKFLIAEQKKEKHKK